MSRQKPTVRGGAGKQFPPDVSQIPTDADVQKMKQSAGIPIDYKQVLGPPFSDMTKVTDNCYLTGVGGLTKENFVKHNIVCIINATIEAPSLNPPGIETIRIAVDDSQQDDMSAHLEYVADKIYEVANKGGSTVVHCVAGVSRSATLCLAYLIKYHKMTLHDAFNLIAQKRVCIRPNNGFFKQLINFEKRVIGKTSVNMVVLEKSGQRIEIPDFFEKEHSRLVLIEVLKAKHAAGSSSTISRSKKSKMSKQ